jgi:hypothetical protein
LSSSVSITFPKSAAIKGRLAHITQDDDGYVVEVRLQNAATSQPGNAVWGDESDATESASETVADLAAKFAYHGIASRLKFAWMTWPEWPYTALKAYATQASASSTTHQIGFH